MISENMHFKINFILFLIVTLSGFIFGQNLNPGDGIKVTFYNISDAISGDYYVSEDSTLQLPYIGTISTSGESYENIKSEIISKYQGLYKDPEISIQPLYRINILGEVKSPGFYYVAGFDRVSDLIAKAGGQTEDAVLNEIIIIRKDKEIKIDIEQIFQKGDKMSDIGLESGDKIYVPRKWWVTFRNLSVIISAAAVVVALVSIIIKK